MSHSLERFPWLTIADVHDGLRSGRFSAIELTRAYLRRIAELNSDPEGGLNALLCVDGEGALAQAAMCDARIAQGRSVRALEGVPMVIKDNLCTRGVPTTCASRILEGYVPPYDAHVLERLREAGAVVLGKTNMDEFAMGSSNENSAFGSAHNPWKHGYAPGGSSGGSAAAVAAGLCVAALGSDTGGSVRQPAAFCGVRAIKPSYGRVSRYGLVAFASSLDQVGPLAHSVRDAAHVLQVIAGYDGRDATSLEAPVEPYAEECGASLAGLRVGVLADEVEGGAHPDVLAAQEQAVQAVRDLGCETVAVSLPHARFAIATYYIVAPAEASSNLARFDGMRYGLRIAGDGLDATYANTREQGFGPEVKRRIMLGTYVLSAGYYDTFYLKAQKVRTRLREDYERAFEKCDVVLSPTTPSAAFPIGQKCDEPLSMYFSDVFTLPASLAGLPALSLPSGLNDDGLPLGVQLVAPYLREALLVRIGDGLDEALAFTLHP